MLADAVMRVPARELFRSINSAAEDSDQSQTFARHEQPYDNQWLT